MQEYSLIADADPEGRACLVVGEPLDVAQNDHLALTRRQIVEGRNQHGHQLFSVQPRLEILLPPIQWVGPMPIDIETYWIDSMKGLYWRVQMLFRSSRPGPIDQNSEEPGLE